MGWMMLKADWTMKRRISWSGSILKDALIFWPTNQIWQNELNIIQKCPFHPFLTVVKTVFNLETFPSENKFRTKNLIIFSRNIYGFWNSSCVRILCVTCSILTRSKNEVGKCSKIFEESFGKWHKIENGLIFELKGKMVLMR